MPDPPGRGEGGHGSPPTRSGSGEGAFGDNPVGGASQPCPLQRRCLEFVGVIHGNFDRRGDMDESRREHLKRVLHPGAILLANLDIDKDIAASRPRSEQLDCKDAIVAGGDDSDEMATLKVRVPEGSDEQACRLVLRVDSADARRIRAFPSGATQPVVFGVTTDQPPMQGTTGCVNEYELPADTGRWHFQVEAVTLAGDWRSPGPTGASLNQPYPFEVYLPDNPTSPVSPPAGAGPVYSERLPGEVWFELLYYDQGGGLMSVRDVAVYTIAPWMMLSNLNRPEVLYICDSTILTENGELIDVGNQDTVRDVERAFQRISGVRLHKIPEAQFTGMLDGEPAYDLWAQDEFQIGYCWAVHNWMHVALHCPRGMGVQNFVRQALPGPDMGLWDSLLYQIQEVRPDGTVVPRGQGADTRDYGGNFELSPPVPRPTGEISADRAGPRVPAQPEAPFGKIIFGYGAEDSPNLYLQDFLKAQKVQPLLSVDVSWLLVSHVDEILTFVPAGGSGGADFRLVLAHPPTGVEMLQAAQALHEQDPQAHPLTGTNRGKRLRDNDRGTGSAPTIVEINRSTVSEFLPSYEVSSMNAWHWRISHIQQRLIAGLSLQPGGRDILYLPVFFRTSGRESKRTSVLPNPVNMVVLGNHVLVPRPFGPCMKLRDVSRILREQGQLSSATEARLRRGRFTDRIYWAFKGERAEHIARYFWVQPNDYPRVTAQQIIDRNLDKFDTQRRVAPDLARLVIPEGDLVDLLQAYTQVALEDLGLTVHWVDTWYSYHLGEGEIHCGTNVKRRPPERDAGRGFRFWWDVYPEMVQ